MLLWFVATAIMAVWYVFRDPRFEYRLLIVGVLIPDVVDIALGGTKALHSVVAPVATMTAVVVASTGRKSWRKAALAVPIGMFLHLVFDGAFSNAKAFWWPVGGLNFTDQRVPSLERGWLNVVLELLGAAGLWWIWRTFALRRATRRRLFLRHGELHPASPAGDAADV